MLCTLIGAIILSINIQVGLDMDLHDDNGDASSSLRGSTSSSKYYERNNSIHKESKLINGKFLEHLGLSKITFEYISLIF